MVELFTELLVGTKGMLVLVELLVTSELRKAFSSRVGGFWPVSAVSLDALLAGD